MGKIGENTIEKLNFDKYEKFIPTILFRREKESLPEVFYFHEFVLQSLVRQYLSQNLRLQKILTFFGLLNTKEIEFEILGEKACPEGHVDFLVKEIHPKGISKNIIMEVKIKRSQKKDLQQLKRYMEEIENECLGGVLISKEVSKDLVKIGLENKIYQLTHSFKNLDLDFPYTFFDLLNNFELFTPEGNKI